MSKIDVDNLIISLLNGQDLTKSEKKILHHALQDQGLRIKDSEIVGIEPEPFEIKMGHWYMCIKDEKYSDIDELMFTSGKIYKSHLDWALLDNRNMSRAFTTEIGWSYREHFRPWTIEDAKPGDVLVDKDGNIGIVNDERHSFSWHSFIYCGEKGKLYLPDAEGVAGCHFKEGTHPATKEQRERLFKEMKENGYGFDFRTNTLLQVPKLKTATGKLKECLDKLKGEMELTEFENKVGKTLEIAIHDGTKSLEPDTIRYFAQELLPIARQQIASEIDIDAIWGELVFRGVERLSREDIEEFVEKIKKGE